MKNPWEKAYLEALERRESVQNRLVAGAVGRVPDQVQRDRYHYFRQNPDKLVEWAGRNTSPTRAVTEAQDYLREMGRRYGNL